MTLEPSIIVVVMTIDPGGDSGGGFDGSGGDFSSERSSGRQLLPLR